jgi:hypothetical protein
MNDKRANKSWALFRSIVLGALIEDVGRFGAILAVAFVLVVCLIWGVYGVLKDFFLSF